jgi:addiction module RelE/StbE family toxin
MRKLVLTPRFKRSYRKYVARNRLLQQRVEDVLRSIQEDVFAPGLGSHKLSGVLAGYWACSCGYDCRIIFSVETDAESGQEVVVLLDIGTHDVVY